LSDLLSIRGLWADRKSPKQLFLRDRPFRCEVWRQALWDFQADSLDDFAVDRLARSAAALQDRASIPQAHFQERAAADQRARHRAPIYRRTSGQAVFVPQRPGGRKGRLASGPHNGNS